MFSCASKHDVVAKKDFKFIHLWYVDAYKDRQLVFKRHEEASPLIVGEDMFQGVSDSDMIVIDKNLGR